MNNNSKSKLNLLLVELLISFMVLLVAYGICLQFFTAANLYSTQSKELNHALILCQSAAETIKSTPADISEAADELGGIYEGGEIRVYYSNEWQISEKSEAVYFLKITFEAVQENFLRAYISLFSEKGEIYSLQTGRIIPGGAK